MAILYKLYQYYVNGILYMQRYRICVYDASPIIFYPATSYHRGFTELRSRDK